VTIICGRRYILSHDGNIWVYVTQYIFCYMAAKPRKMGIKKAEDGNFLRQEVNYVLKTLEFTG